MCPPLHLQCQLSLVWLLFCVSAIKPVCVNVRHGLLMSWCVHPCTYSVSCHWCGFCSVCLLSNRCVWMLDMVCWCHDVSIPALTVSVVIGVASVLCVCYQTCFVWLLDMVCQCHVHPCTFSVRFSLVRPWLLFCVSAIKPVLCGCWTYMYVVCWCHANIVISMDLPGISLSDKTDC